MIYEKKLKIAITGGIASGKSALSQFLINHGEHVIDLDVISHNLTTNDKPTINLILNKFGEGILDQSGSIDRAKLSNIVFNNFKFKKDLEEILHPKIRNRMNQLIHSSKKERVFVEVQLLAEKNMGSLFDHIIIVSVSKGQQINRLKTIRMMDSNLINQILDSQLTDEERKSKLSIYSNDILENNESEGAFQKKIESLYKKLVNQ